jgi:hypothetical protein
MKRLNTRGSSLMTPKLSEGELKHALGKLGVAAVFSDADVYELYLEIAAICGLWLSEQGAKEAPPVAKALKRTGKGLMEASSLLNGHATGLRSTIQLEVTSRAIAILALDPTVGGLDQARQLVAAFQENAAKIGHACLIAYADQSRNAPNDGRAPMLWYDKFTALLLWVSEKAGVEPNLNKDRIDESRGGWLFEAAQALEQFLDPWMRSPSPEACGKRLERSRKRVVNGHRQNP